MDKLGRVSISYELLEEFLKIPKDHKITQVFDMGEDFKHRIFTVVISGPDCPLIEHGDKVPEVQIQYEKIDSKIIPCSI